MPKSLAFLLNGLALTDSISNMVLISAITLAFKNYVNFQGRAGRGEYWWFALASAIVATVTSTLSATSSFYAAFYGLYVIAVFIPALSLAVRRLHDTDRSGFWLFLFLVPFFGVIILIVFLAQKGTPIANRFGTPPLQLTA